MDCLRMKRLINKASSYLGMIQEAKMRCVLLKGKMKRAVSEGDVDLNKFKSELNQIKYDINKYSRKLKLVYEEIKLNEVQFDRK